MTTSEAIKAMRAGSRVRLPNWFPEIYLEAHKNGVQFEATTPDLAANGRMLWRMWERDLVKKFSDRADWEPVKEPSHDD